MSLLLLLRGTAVEAPTRSLVLTPATFFPGVGSSLNVTATLLDEDSNPLVAKTIYFDVTGVNTASGSDTTDVNGEATFQYTVTNAGTDLISARWGSGDGLNLMSSDISTDVIYQHDGFSATVLDTISTGVSATAHVTWDGDNVLSRDTATVQKYTGFALPVQATFNAGATISGGLAHDGTNVIASTATDTVIRFDGFSNTVLQTLTFPGLTISGVGWDGENLLLGIAVSLAADEVRRYVGFSTVLDQTLTMPFTHPVVGVAWDGDNLIVGADDLGGSGTSPIYRMDGFSATVDTQIASPNSQISGVGFTMALQDSVSVSANVRGSGRLGTLVGNVVP